MLKNRKIFIYLFGKKLVNQTLIKILIVEVYIYNY